MPTQQDNPIAPQQPAADPAADGAASPDASSPALRSETEAQAVARRIVPWLASVAVHLGVIALGFLITWSVALTRADEEQVRIVADFDALAYDPVAMVDTDLAIGEERPADPPLEVDDFIVDEAWLEMQSDAPDVFAEAITGPPPMDFSPPPTGGSATFLGLSSTNAESIVYVIDASGGMIAYLQIILQELARSLERLSEQQSFAIVFFQRNEAVPVRGGRRLIPATEGEKIRALQWIDENIIPAGRSNPLAAFEVALRLNPDVIFLLSDNITGSGIFEVDQEELLATLDRLNPIDRATGQRGTQINCIQFLDPDPLDTLRRIAEEHGGPRAYKFLSRAELGLVVP